METKLNEGRGGGDAFTVNTICSRKYAAYLVKTANAGTVNTGSSRHCKHDPEQAL
jgi:hypothetical protein